MNPIRHVSPWTRSARTAPLLLACTALWLAFGPILALPAAAGCGCDHPPADWSVVMPPFGSPGKTVTIFAEGGEFEVGQTYAVSFGDTSAQATATSTDRIEAKVPRGTAPGPVGIRVTGNGYDHSYPRAAFTAMANPRRIREREGVFAARRFKAAISEDGTLYLPLDVSEVLDAMQFTFAFTDLPLAFSHDDVVIYNADGVDLTLFALEVDDPTQRQWGSYYGWTVEDDAGMHGEWYEPQADDSDDVARISTLFTYWRHEFHSYEVAHAPGGSHEVDANGFHPDGTLHVDHSNLVIAISGRERDASAPADLSRARPLEPGMRRADIGWISLRVDQPVELFMIEPLLDAADGPFAEILEEILFDDD